MGKYVWKPSVDQPGRLVLDRSVADRVICAAREEREQRLIDRGIFSTKEMMRQTGGNALKRSFS